jgi:hypothetical protein
MDPRSAGKVRDLTVILPLLPYLEAEVEALQRQVDVKVSMEINKGTLTPDKALAYWSERNALASLINRFHGRVSAGQAAGVPLSNIGKKTGEEYGA